FVGAPQLAANPGPGLALLLARELKKHKVAVKTKGAKFGLTGEFREVSDEKDRALWLELKIHIVDRKNKAQQILSCPLFDPADMPWLLGANTRLPDERDPKGRLAKLREDLDNPPVVIKGTQASVGPDQPYAVEILVSNYSRRVVNEDGVPYVRINRGEIY